ncbi:ergothioneine biosynthesis protein EgtB, partial [Streptomyces sp. NPDC003393]
MTDPTDNSAGAGEATVDIETQRERAIASLITARERTTLLTSCVEEPDLTAQHSPLMS